MIDSVNQEKVNSGVALESLDDGYEAPPEEEKGEFDEEEI